MRKRIISFFLILTMLVNMIPVLALKTDAESGKVHYFVVDDMTEAEAFAAGPHVYIAWHNYHEIYAEEYSNPIDILYNYPASAFNQLYKIIYPDGPDSSKGHEVLNDAYEWLEDFYDGVDQYTEIEDDLVMSILLSCFLYTGHEDGNGSSDAVEVLTKAQDVALNTRDVSTFYWIDHLSKYSTKFSGNFSPLEFLAEQGSEFSKIDLGGNLLFSFASEKLLTMQEKNDALEKAAKYETVKSVAASDIEILREFENHGMYGKYVKTYLKTYEEMIAKGESSLREALLSKTGNSNDMIINMTTEAITTAASSVAAGTAGAVALGAAVISATLGGFALFNILEGVFKLSGNGLFGQEAMKSSDLSLFYLHDIRSEFYNGYQLAYTEFGHNPTPENAQKLNTYSRLMYRIFAASEMYASQMNHTYATAGALNAEWMHAWIGKIDPSLTAYGENESGKYLNLREDYLDEAFEAYGAFFDRSVYTLEFNLNGGCFPAAEALGLGSETVSFTKVKTIDINIPAGIPVRDGYAFVGWTTDSAGKTADPAYAPGTAYQKDQDLKLYALWKVDANISYNANGGKDAPASQENTEGPTVISTQVPTREGFTFLGWAESASASAPAYQPGDTLTKEGPVTLYAIWQAGIFDIVFHANGGTYADGSDSKTLQKTYLKSFAISPEIPVREGYVFSGYWTLKEDGSGTQYNQGQSYSDIGGSGLSAKHLYAQWTKSKTEVIFRYDYSDCTFTDITVPLTDGSATITLTDPPREKIAAVGKDFLQWKYYYPDGSGYQYYQTGDTITLTDDFTLYAQWEEPSGKPILSVLTDKAAYLPGDTVKISITASNSGYFTVDASGNTGFTIRNAEGSKTASGVFVENSSESSSDSLKCYDNGSSYTVMLYLPKNCPDGGYPLKITVSNGTYGVDGTQTSSATETITVTVNSTEEETASYVLGYDLNGGYGTIPDPEYFEEGDHVQLARAKGFQRDGYEFGGWSKNADGSGKNYKAGNDYQFTESTLLYAIWESVAADADELMLALGVERYSKVYKPGETAYIMVLADNSDHFFIDVNDCEGFTVLGAMGLKLKEATYIEKSSPAFITGEDGYTNGSNKYIPVYIPSDCEDGQYTIFVTATDGILDQTTGEKIKCSATIYVRESDIPDSISLNRSEMILHIGQERALKATVEPQYIFNEYNEKEVSWSTSNSKVVSLDERGNRVDVSGVRSGTATVTAEVDGVTVSCTVTVEKCDYSVKEVEEEYLASAATCESQATYYYVCSCGEVSSETYKVGSLEDHKFSSWTVLQEATDTAAGVEQRLCAACGATEERVIPATGAHTEHTPGESWYSSTDSHWKLCAHDGCEVRLSEAEHTFGELTVETPATDTNPGLGYITCQQCNYTESRKIPILAATLYEVTVEGGAGDGTYAPGEEVVLIADPPETGKQFTGWDGLEGLTLVFGDANCEIIIITMPEAPVSVRAVYEDIPQKPVYTITVLTDGNGTASANAASSEAAEAISLQAVANPGYRFKEWQVPSGNVVVMKNMFTMPYSDVTVKAIFAEDTEENPDTYMVTVTDGSGSGSYEHAAEVTIEARDITGYTFEQWEVVSGTVVLADPSAPKTTFTMPASDVDLKAVYRKNDSGTMEPTLYLLNFEENGGTIVYSISAEAGSVIPLDKFITQREGCSFTGWYQDEALTQAVTSVVLSENMTVYAGWEPISVDPEHPCDGGKNCPSIPFTDVDQNQWYHEAIDYAITTGLMNGVSSNMFDVNGTTTRAQIVTILWRLEGQPSAKTSPSFADVPAGQWYSNAIAWAASEEIVTGYGNGLFGTDDSITREQLATILWRYARDKGYDVSAGEATNLGAFKDVDDISYYALGAMQWASGAGILNGADGKIMPGDNALRCQVAAMFQRFQNNVAR